MRKRVGGVLIVACGVWWASACGEQTPLAPPDDRPRDAGRDADMGAQSTDGGHANDADLLRDAAESDGSIDGHMVGADAAIGDAAMGSDGAATGSDGAATGSDGGMSDAETPADAMTRRDGAPVPDGGPPPRCTGAMDPPEPSRCRTESDCRGMTPEYCRLSSERVCGACVMPVEGCDADRTDSCASGQACVRVPVVCSCGGPSTECRARCTGGSCGAAERCDMETGICAPISCRSGYVCPANFVCTPGAGGSDAHGCQRRTCSFDSECDCGFCLNGLCAETYGTCTAVMR